MVSHSWRIAAAFAAAIVSTGCSGLGCGSGCKSGSPYAFMKYDCSSGGVGGCAGCGDACTCGSGCTGGGSSGADGACGCSSCGGAGCDACGGCSLYRNKWCKCGPFPVLRWIGGWLDCAGCGECYYNEWYNDPPACADPCDCYGNWAGSGGAGYYRAPYRMHHGWVAGQGDAQTPEAAPLEQGPTSLTALDEAAAASGSDAIVSPAQTAVYDDSALNPELQ